MKVLKVTGKIDFAPTHPMLEHFKFLKAHTTRTPKMCIPSPTVMHFRLEPGSVAASAYPDRDAIFDDLAIAYQKAIKAFYAAGCRYLQFDDTAWAFLCAGRTERRVTRPRRRSPRRPIPGASTRRWKQSPPTWSSRPMSAAAISAQPSFRRAAMSRWRKVCSPSAITTATSWSTIPTAPAASSRCFLPEGQQARGAGLDHLQIRPAGTARRRQETHRGGDQVRRARALCLSPQCGFASTEEGNVLAEDEQWAKLRMVVELSEEVWGK